MLCSQVVSLGPHGAKFYEDEPALLYLPLGAHIDDPNMIVCLCSDTGEGDIPDWKPLPKSHYHYISKDNKVCNSAARELQSCWYLGLNR